MVDSVQEAFQVSSLHRQLLPRFSLTEHFAFYIFNFSHHSVFCFKKEKKVNSDQ